MTSVFEETNLSKAILRVGLPAMLGQLTTLIYNMADTFFVSLTREPSMIAAVTLCTPILLIIMSIACVFGMGGSSVIARQLGEGRREPAGKTLNFCTYAMLLSGAVTAALGLLFLPQIARIAGADAENMAYTCDYLRYIFLGAPCIMLSNGSVHLFRSAGLIRESTVGLFRLLGRQLAGIFLHEEPLIAQTAQFLHVLCLSAPALGVINMVKSYFQALGRALRSLVITVLRNAVLFIPAVIPPKRLWELQGVFTVQPAVEGLLCGIFLALYAGGKQAQSTRENPLHAAGELPFHPLLPTKPGGDRNRPVAVARPYPFRFCPLYRRAVHRQATVAKRQSSPKTRLSRTYNQSLLRRPEHGIVLKRGAS